MSNNMKLQTKILNNNYFDTVGVPGSIPGGPTIFSPFYAVFPREFRDHKRGFFHWVPRKATLRHQNSEKRCEKGVNGWRVFS